MCCEDDREEAHGYDPYNRRGGPRPSYHDRAAAARAEAAALADAVRESDEAAQAIAVVEGATRREEEAAEAARRRAHSEMLKEGARVSFLGTYPGKITAVNFNGTFAILLDDGTKMPSAQAEKIELIAPPCRQHREHVKLDTAGSNGRRRSRLELAEPAGAEQLVSACACTLVSARTLGRACTV